MSSSQMHEPVRQAVEREEPGVESDVEAGVIPMSANEETGEADSAAGAVPDEDEGLLQEDAGRAQVERPMREAEAEEQPGLAPAWEEPGVPLGQVEGADTEAESVEAEDEEVADE